MSKDLGGDLLGKVVFNHEAVSIQRREEISEGMIRGSCIHGVGRTDNGGESRSNGGSICHSE